MVVCFPFLIYWSNIFCWSFGNIFLKLSRFVFSFFFFCWIHWNNVYRKNFSGEIYLKTKFFTLTNNNRIYHISVVDIQFDENNNRIFLIYFHWMFVLNFYCQYFFAWLIFWSICSIHVYWFCSGNIFSSSSTKAVRTNINILKFSEMFQNETFFSDVINLLLLTSSSYQNVVFFQNLIQF